MKINKEILAKADDKIKTKNYINKCFLVGVCPYCGQDVNNKKSTCNENGEETCGRTRL